jgi:amidohydrolase
VATHGELADVRRRLVQEIDSFRPLVQDIAVSLYEHPETGLNEVFASDKLTRVLAKAGFAVQTGIAGMPTAFLARAGTGKPAIAVMAEYDALPGLGHGCGHNLIAASAVAAGIALRTVSPPGQPSDSGGCGHAGVYATAARAARLDAAEAGAASEEAGAANASWIVLGTPAEETVGGKVAMSEAGVFGEIDAALIAHPSQRNSVGGGVHWASHPLEITFHGRASHAGGNPEEGVNALDACIAAYIAVRNLRNHLRDPVRIAGIITRGGDAQNVVPELAQMRFTLRSTDWRYLEEAVIPKVKACAEGAALSHAATPEFRHHEPLFRETLEYPVLADLAKRNFEYLGEEIPPPPPLAGGGVTDVGNVTWVTPCIQVSYRATSARGHSREMAESTLTPEGIAAALTAAKVLALTAHDLAANPALLQQAKKHLAEHCG